MTGKMQLPRNLLTIKADLKKKQYSTFQKELESSLSKDDQYLLHKIRTKTIQLNVNNITRTKAYLDFYLRCPEIEWAFLGHMVSRNGGWNMTDLKGEILSRLMSEKSVQAFFAFLERETGSFFKMPIHSF